MVLLRPGDGVIVAANDAWCSLTGYDRTEIEGRPWSQLAFTTERDRPSSIQEPASSRETEVRTRSGEFLIVEERTTAIELDGEPLLLRCAIDLTHERRLLLDLERSRADLARAQEITRTGSYAFDVRTNEVLPSDELLRLLSIDTASFGGTLGEILERVHPEDLSTATSAIEVVQKDHVVPSLLVRVLTADGEVRWVQSHGELEVDPEGTPLRVVGTVQDVTERVLLEQEGRRLLARVVELREADRREVAEELQDGLLQALSALLLRLDIIGSRTGSHDAEELERVSLAVRRSMQRVRRVVFDLRPTALDHGVGPAVEELAARMLAAWDLVVHVEDTAGGSLPQDARSLAYRFVREALAALAPGTAQVRIAWEDGLLVEVRHRGRGRLDDADRPLLEEVAELAGGSLDVRGNGETCLLLRLPDPNALSV
jgi:PAS domain S-box-containing protein